MASEYKKLINSTNIPESLVKAVVRQMGGWSNFKNYAPDICNNGIDGGYGKFIYYSDTIPFYKRNKSAIRAMAFEQARDFGMGIIEMIQGFGAFRNDPQSEEEILTALTGGPGASQTIQNVLAWYAGEEVARAYCDMKER